MTRPTFSPARVLIVCLLVWLTLSYLSAMTRNTTPHGLDRDRYEQGVRP